MREREAQRCHCYYTAATVGVERTQKSWSNNQILGGYKQKEQ